MPQFDVVVVGLGVIGSATLHELTRRGVRAIGIERVTPGHDGGSSHGDSRMIRLGYFEHPSYVPLLRRTYALWRELETASQTKLLHITGIAEIGPPDGAVVGGTLSASKLHGLTHEVLDAAETMRRFPAFDIPAHYACVFQPEGGFIAADTAIATLNAMAWKAGASLQTGVAVCSVIPERGGVRILTSNGEIEAGMAIVTAGPWVKQLLPGLRAPLRVTRQVMSWFKPGDPTLFGLERFPVFLLESRHGVHYGFPSIADGIVKIAKHHHNDQATDPDTVERMISQADETLIRAAIAEHIPAANGALAAAKTCLYTMTPDHDFIIDRMPGAPSIVIASPCSGHGFKFAPVIGEALADLAITGETKHDIGRFGLARFA